MKQRILLIFMWVMFPLCLTAQGNFPLLQIQISDLLQYQAQKIKRTIPSSFFSKYGFQQIRTELVVGLTDTRQLWGWHVGPNPNFNSLQQPLYRLFEKKDDSSIAIVDDKDGHLQIIFWDKAYYRIFSKNMQQYGYQLQAKKPANNILRFQRMGISVVIDITVWADMYVLDLFQL